MNKLLPLGLAAAFALTSVASLAATVTPSPDKAAQAAPTKVVSAKDAKAKIKVVRTHHKAKAAHHKKSAKPQPLAQVKTKPKADVK